MSVACSLLHALRDHLKDASAGAESSEDNLQGEDAAHADTIHSLVRCCCPALLSSTLERCQQVLMLKAGSEPAEYGAESCVDGWEVVGMLSVAGGAIGAVLALASDSECSLIAKETMDALRLSVDILRKRELQGLMPVTEAALLLAAVALDAVKVPTLQIAHCCLPVSYVDYASTRISVEQLHHPHVAC
jgi:hypothetical protein